MSFKHSIGVLFTVPTATHMKRVLLLPKKTQGLLVASKGCLEYCCSMALVQTIFYMCSECAYFQVKSSPFE